MAPCEYLLAVSVIVKLAGGGGGGGISLLQTNIVII